MERSGTRVVVLGAGRIGGAISLDLARNGALHVTAADCSRGALDALASRGPVKIVETDLARPRNVADAVAEADLVVSAVPGFLGFETLRAVIEAGRNVVDIAFSPEDPLTLDDLAETRDVTAIVDCGVAPGLTNMLAGRVAARLDRVDRFECYVGGLPVERHPPFEYKAGFSPIDVLEEYTRPARMVEDGREVVRPALSEVELIDVPGVGTLEAFNTDGLRSLRHTMSIPWMKEKTLRYPGHADLMRAFRDVGLLATRPVNVGGVSVRPIDLTSRLLSEHWTLEEGEADLTVMRVIAEGVAKGRSVRHTFDLLDYYDAEGGVSSMARTTGYTCSIVAQQVLAGLFARRGVSPPELIGSEAACYEGLLVGYAERGINLSENAEILSEARS